MDNHILRDPENVPLQLTVVLPIYNEADTLDEVLGGTVELLMSKRISFEVIAIDDGSTDQSLPQLRTLGAKYPEFVRIARHLENKGYGSSLRTGIRLARGSIVLTMDADGQHLPDEIEKLLAQIPPYDMVIGVRSRSYAGPWYRNLANRFYNHFASWLTRFEVQDLTSGFRAMRKTAVEHFLHLYPRGFSASATVTLAFLKAGYQLKYVPVEVNSRSGGKSKIHLWEDGIRFLLLMLRMIMLYDPLCIFLPTSAVLAGLGLGAWGLGIWHEARLIVPNSAIFLFTTCIVVFLLGLVSSQLSSLSVGYYGDETVILESHTDDVPANKHAQDA